MWSLFFITKFPMSAPNALTFRVKVLKQPEELKHYYKAVMEEKHIRKVDSTYGCIESTRAPRNYYPSIKCYKTRDDSTTTYCYVVAMCYRWRFIDNKEEAWPRGWDVSHRCGNRLCVKLSHLTVELHEINQSRETCPPSLTCTKCKSTIKACQHRPCCLKEPLDGLCTRCDEETEDEIDAADW